MSPQRESRAAREAKRQIHKLRAQIMTTGDAMDSLAAALRDLELAVAVELPPDLEPYLHELGGMRHKLERIVSMVVEVKVYARELEASFRRQMGTQPGHR